MAAVSGLPLNSPRESSSALLASFNSLQHPLLPNWRPSKGVSSVVGFSIGGFVSIVSSPRRRSASFKLCRTAEEHPEILFFKIDFDENTSLCKSLDVKVLPCFHFYRGADGKLDSFSCSLAKYSKILDAIKMHHTGCGSIGPTVHAEDLHLEITSFPREETRANEW